MFRLWLPKHDIVITVPPRCASQHARVIYKNSYRSLDPAGQELVSLGDIPQYSAEKLIKKSTNWIVYREHHDRLASNFYNKQVDPTGASWRSKTPYQRIYFRCATFRSFTQKVFWNLSVHQHFRDDPHNKKGWAFSLDPHVAPYKVLLYGKFPDKIFHFTEIEELYRSIEEVVGLDPQPPNSFIIPRGDACNNYLSDHETIQFLSGKTPIPDNSRFPPGSTFGASPWPVPHLELIHMDQYLEFYHVQESKFPQPWALWSRESWDAITEIYSEYDADIISESLNAECTNPLVDKYEPLQGVGDELHTLLGPNGDAIPWDWSNMKEKQQFLEDEND